MSRFSVRPALKPLLACVLMAISAAGAGENIAQQILEMTGGARTKITWARYHATKDHWIIPVFDTQEGHERILVADTTTPGYPWGHPHITPSGNRVIYNARPGSGNNIFVIDWNGANVRALCAGEYSVGVAEDPPGIEWVYVVESGKLYRHQIDNPTIRELVWDKTAPISNNWAFTRDGKMAATGLPWPSSGVAHLPNVSFQILAGGCADGLAPDGNHFFHFKSDHKGLYMTDKSGANERFIDCGKAPGVEGYPVHYPAWAHYDSRFVSVTGGPPGKPSTVLFGQFDEKFTTVVRWVQVAASVSGDLGSYAWIQPATAASASSSKATDGLSVKLLSSVANRLDQASKFKPILDDLQKRADAAKNPDEVGEAKQIIAHIDAWGKRLLSAAKEQETQNPRDAETIYKTLAAKLDGLETGTVAQERLKDKALQDGPKAWVYVEKLQKAESALLDAPGAARSAADQKFAAQNKTTLGTMKAAAKSLQDQYAHTCVIPTANEILQRYGLEPITLKRAPPAPDFGVTMLKKSDDPWPSSRNGLLFLWENKAKQLIYDASGAPMQPSCLAPHGLARFERSYAMRLEEGAFVAQNAEKYLAAQFQNSRAFTLEAWVTPAKSTTRGPAEIITFGTKAETRNFFLAQDGGKLFFGLKTSENAAAQPLELCAAVAGQPYHIVVSYSSGALTGYKNGKAVAADNNVKGAFGNWSEQPLLFGNNAEFQRPWAGTLEGVAIYNRALDDKEAQQNFAIYQSQVSARKAATQIEVQAKLLARSPSPAYEQIAPYTEALVICEYEVEKVLSGAYAQHKIRVAHWGMIDRKPLAIGRVEPGRSFHLRLEPLKENPQLESAYLSDTLPIDPNAVLYFDTTSLATDQK